MCQPPKTHLDEQQSPVGDRSWTVDEDGVVRWTDEGRQPVPEAGQDDSDDTVEDVRGTFEGDDYPSMPHEDQEPEPYDEGMPPYQPYERHKEVQTSLAYPVDNESRSYAPVNQENGIEEEDYEDETDNAVGYYDYTHGHDQPDPRHQPYRPGTHHQSQLQYEEESREYGQYGEEPAVTEYDEEAPISDNPTHPHHTGLAYGEEADDYDSVADGDGPVWEDGNPQAQPYRRSVHFEKQHDGDPSRGFGDPRPTYTNPPTGYDQSNGYATWAEDDYEEQPRTDASPSQTTYYDQPPATRHEGYWEVEDGEMGPEAIANPSSDADFHAWLSKQGLADAWQMAATETTAF